LVHHLVSARAFPNDNCTRFDVLLTAWKLGDFIRLARDAELRFFIEHLQQFANAIVENMDEDETAP